MEDQEWHTCRSMHVVELPSTTNETTPGPTFPTTLHAVAIRKNVGVSSTGRIDSMCEVSLS